MLRAEKIKIKIVEIKGYFDIFVYNRGYGTWWFCVESGGVQLYDWFVPSGYRSRLAHFRVF